VNIDKLERTDSMMSSILQKPTSQEEYGGIKVKSKRVTHLMHDSEPITYTTSVPLFKNIASYSDVKISNDQRYSKSSMAWGGFQSSIDQTS